MKFKTKLGEYHSVETQDGHFTLYSGAYEENCHSTSGAYTETLHNYVHGCDVIDRANKSPINILEIGFGVGLGVLATYKETSECKHQITFITTEIDPELAHWVIGQDSFTQIITTKTVSDERIELQLGNKFKVIILLGDARETIKLLALEDYRIDCIYQDAFSPRHNPSLWTYEHFMNLRSICTNDCVMTTYSAAVKIRKAILNSGFFVTNMKGFGNKRSGTRAFTNIVFQDLKVEDTIRRSQTPPLTDKDI